MCIPSVFRWEASLLAYVSSFRHPFINISCSSDGMFSSEVRRNGLSCVPYFTLSVVLVFAFIFVTNHDRSSEIFSYKDAFMIALYGTLGPLMAVATTFDLMLALGFAFNSITLVVPFLIIGAGCDDVFIIVHAWRKTNRSDQLDARIAKTMEEAGPSITVTSLTNGLSFAVGGLANTPAIRLFCIYAAVGVLIDFIYQITFFAAAMVYEGIRSTKVSESKSKIALEMQKIREENYIPGSHNGIVSKYCCQLKKWQCRVMILIALFLYWIAAIYNCHRMTVKMDSTNLLLRDSPLNNVAWIYERYLWREGSLVHVFINNPPDLSVKSNQLSILEMVSRFESMPHSMGKNSTSLWLRSFLSQVSMFSSEQNNRFFELLGEWLKDNDDGGGRWNDMIRLRYINGSAVGIEKFMFATASAMGDHASWTLRAQLQEEWRQLALKYQHYNVTIFQPYSFYVDQLNSIKPTTASTVVVAMATMALACILMIPSASSIISSTLAMISINVGVFGGLSMLGVYLDPLAMCTTLMSIGFSVDFTAHISYHYYRCPSTWPSDVRIADALRSIGWPMVQAGISTILSVSPLLLIDSYMVLVFIKTIFLVIGLGLLHGIVFLPVLLLTTGSSVISDKPPPHPPLARTFAENKFERVLSVPRPSAGSQGKQSLRRIEASHSW
uniref:SSD domain-containing protein n=1 Tax=Parascaris univalens TaxID=6257 RepID=A0A915C1G2_PARUN